jgi:hypothetical protein
MWRPVSPLYRRRALFVALSLLPWVAAYALGTFVDAFRYRLPTPLMEAVRQNRVADVKALLAQGADVHEKASYGSTALSVAGDTENAPLAKLLIEAGANVNERLDGGTPILMRAVGHASWSGRSTEVVELLLAHGADVHARTIQGGHPVLRYAATVDFVRVLVRAGADVNASDCAGNVPLGLAVKGTEREPPRGDLAVIRSLLEAGARPPQYAIARLRTLAAADPHVLALLDRAPVVVPVPYREGPCRLPAGGHSEYAKALSAWGNQHRLPLSPAGWEFVISFRMWGWFLPPGLLFLFALVSLDGFLGLLSVGLFFLTIAVIMFLIAWFGVG